MSNAAVPMYRIYELPWSTALEDDDEVQEARARLARSRRSWLRCILGAARAASRSGDGGGSTETARAARARARGAAAAAGARRSRGAGARAGAGRRGAREPEPVPEPERVVEPEPVVGAAARRSHPAGARACARRRTIAAHVAASSAAQQRHERPDSTAPTSVAADSNAPFAERSLITSRVGTASGGINTAALSRNTGGSGLGGRETTQVENPVEGFAEAGAPRSAAAKATRLRAAARKSSASSTPTRAASSRSTIVRYARIPRFRAKSCCASRSRRTAESRSARSCRRSSTMPSSSAASCSACCSSSSRLATTSSPSRPRSRSTSSPLDAPCMCRSAGGRVYSGCAWGPWRSSRSTRAFLKGENRCKRWRRGRNDQPHRAHGQLPDRSAADPRVRALPRLADHGRLRRPSDGLRRDDDVRRVERAPSDARPAARLRRHAGVLAGAIIFSTMADKIGRRPVLVGATLFYAVMTVATAFAQDVEQMRWLRFIAGFGLGSIIPNATALVGEYSPKRTRVAWSCASRWASRPARRSAASSRTR